MANFDWLTTEQLEEQGIPRHLVYRWGAKLAEVGHAQKISRWGRNGAWLVTQEGAEFLRTRIGKVGRPREDELLLTNTEGSSDGMVTSERDCTGHTQPH